MKIFKKETEIAQDSSIVLIVRIFCTCKLGVLFTKLPHYHHYHINYTLNCSFCFSDDTTTKIILPCMTNTFQLVRQYSHKIFSCSTMQWLVGAFSNSNVFQQNLREITTDEGTIQEFLMSSFLLLRQTKFNVQKFQEVVQGAWLPGKWRQVNWPLS